MQWQILEVRVPARIEASIKRMEHVYVGLSNALSYPWFTFWDKYWYGKQQEWFSLEMAAEENDIRFYVRTPAGFRNLIEANIYAQYPDAEITQAEDYTAKLPSLMPNKEYDIWGTNIIFTQPSPYPLKTYIVFEGQSEEQRIDPLNSIAEAMSKIGPREHIYFQLIIKPISNELQKESAELVGKLIGKKLPAKQPGLLAALNEFVGNLVLAPLKIPIWTATSSKKEHETPASLMMYLSPGEKDLVEKMEMKMSKPAFATTIRVAYIAPREIFHREHISSLMSSFKLFGSLSGNSFKPDKYTLTTSHHPFKALRLQIRKRELIYKYRLRLPSAKQVYMNSEELATIWHFPTIAAEAPSLQHIEAKRKGPPANLPT